MVYFESKAELDRVRAAAGIAKVSTFIRKAVLDAIATKAESAA
jgi:hypothetical protein